MGELGFVDRNGARPGKSTYSDLPIQMAERSLSRQEFFSEVRSDSDSYLEDIFSQISTSLDNSYCLTDDSFTYNDILNRGTVNLRFLILQHFSLEVCSINSLLLSSQRLMIEKECSADVHAASDKLRLENVKGAFVVLFDGKKRMRSEIRTIYFERHSGEELAVFFECENPLSRYGAGSIIRLSLVARSESKADASDRLRRDDKVVSMKQFRRSYSDLESLAVSQSIWLRLKLGFIDWQKKLFRH